jgi:hypothetical protein
MSKRFQVLFLCSHLDATMAGLLVGEAARGSPKRDNYCGQTPHATYRRYCSSTLFSWQTNSISSSFGASRQLTRTVQGFV